MRVLLVTNDFPPRPGGIQQYLRDLVGAIDADVRVLAPKDPSAGTEPGVFRGSRRFMWPHRGTRGWVRRHIAEFDPDVVLFGAPHPLAHMGPRLRRETGVPYAVLCHGAEVTVPAAIPLLRSLVAFPLRRADALFAVSEFTARRVRRLARQEVLVVGAGVGSEFTPGSAPAEMVIGCVSRFVPRKGQRSVLRAAARLRRRGHEVSVLLVGRGRDEQALRSLADRLGVPTRFEVDVAFADLPDLYRDMTIFAMPCRSRWFGLEAEGLGIVFLEAAASGLPVVAGDSGGAPETVLPGRSGFVVRDDETLFEALEMLVEDAERRREMGSAGAAFVAEHFAWSTVAGRIEAALKEIVAEGDGDRLP